MAISIEERVERVELNVLLELADKAADKGEWETAERLYKRVVDLYSTMKAERRD